MYQAIALNNETLRDARALRDLVEMEQGQDAGGVDLLLLTLLDTFIQDQEYEAGLTCSPYYDDLQRRSFLKQVLRTADHIFDKFAEYFGDEPLPPAAVGLCSQLFVISLVTLGVVKTIESECHDHEAYFVAERDAYARSRGTA